jgi:peptide/nickel transport system substrate-binding protein
LFVAACGGESEGKNASGNSTGLATGEPQQGGSFTYAVSGDAGNLDPARCGTNDWLACTSVFGTLLTYDNDSQEFSSGMAQSFETTDGVAWTLKLRDGMSFTDGEPFDADAIIYNWERIKDPANFSAGGSIAKALTWTKVDAKTVQVVSTTPNYMLPWALTNELAYIGSPKAIAAKGADFTNQPVGAGPFALQTWTRGTQMVLKKNPDYWDNPRPYVDTFTIKAIPAEDQRLNALRSGEVDAMFTLQASVRKQAQGAKLAETNLVFPFGTGYRWSHTKGDLADPDVSKAVAMLIDTQQLSDAFYAGAAPLTTMAPKDSPYHSDVAYPERDVNGAKKLLDGYLERSGKSKVTLEFKTIGGNPQAEAQAQMFQAQLAAGGIDLKIVLQDAATWFADTQRSNYQVQGFAISGLSPDQMYKYFHTGASGNTTGYSNAEADKFMDAARSASTIEEQNKAFQDAVGVLTETLAYLAHQATTVAIFSKPGTVGDIVPSFTFFLRPDLVWVKK